ncbi:MAG TPA: Clp1/GlmU family protein [Candidatus Ozemobacteraceae bacterium]|nr:Clp1/GlmU family protein [Candidatus Ozemobacteraceae bacterium]
MNYRIEREENHLLVGPAKFKVVSGAVEVIAAKLETGKSLTVPVGKRVPILGLESSQLELEAAEGAITKMEASSIPPEWDKLAEDIVREHKAGQLSTIMVLGEVDTGKTFFSTYLANRLTSKLGRTAILDCDTGQSDIGPCGSFGMLVLKEPCVFLTEEPATHLYMLGAHSPGLHFLPALTGLSAMMKKARAGADALIIDTTGWVQGDGGRAIKKAKLDIVDPDKVVLMQRGTELEHLVKHLPPEKIVRLPVSKKASSTSQMERKQLRELVNVKYFKDARVLEVPFRQVITDRCYFMSGTKFDLEGTLWAEKLSGWEGTFVVTSGSLLPEMTKKWPKDLGMVRTFVSGEEKGLMIALLDANQDVLAIGRLETIDFLNNAFRIRAPFKGDIGRIRSIQMGSLKLSEKGEEAGFLEPGSL